MHASIQRTPAPSGVPHNLGLLSSCALRLRKRRPPSARTGIAQPPPTCLTRDPLPQALCPLAPTSARRLRTPGGERHPLHRRCKLDTPAHAAYLLRPQQILRRFYAPSYAGPLPPPHLRLPMRSPQVMHAPQRPESSVCQRASIVSQAPLRVDGAVHLSLSLRPSKRACPRAPRVKHPCS